MMLMKEIIRSARAGQTLPLCTIFLLCHAPIHVFADFSSSAYSISLSILILNGIVNLTGYIFLVKLYQHSVKHIFNKDAPMTITECMPSFCAHLSLLRPIEVMFRYCTHSWRVLPDIIVLGEARCGTTTLCQHLALLQNHSIDSHTPFCLWAHPELDHKETFFFVGHYLGYVTPSHYRMCFPLKITKWFSGIRSKWWKSTPKSFITFDGCAQYLTSPTAPYLIAEAYRAANQPPPILIACVRNPKDQALSWWKYENNAIRWGEGMGLTKPNSIRGNQYPYPPKTINDALNYGTNDETSNLYRRAESLFSSDDLMQCSERNTSIALPAWSMTWPGGQMSGIGRNARFLDNIMRFERVFHSMFSRYENGEEQNNFEKLKYVNMVPMNYLSDKALLKGFLADILKKVSKRRNGKERIEFEKAVHSFILGRDDAMTSVHRNAIGYGTSISKDSLLKTSLKFFEQERQKLESLCNANNVTFV